MNFDLTIDQQLLADTIDRMFASRFPLTYVREIFDGSVGHADDLWHAYSDLGLFAILVPTEYDGLGGDLLDLAIAAERLGYAAAPGPFLEHVLATLAIAIGGSSDQKSEWLPGLATGSLRATLAVAETPARWAMEEWTMGANARLYGEKHWVPYPELADVAVVGTVGGLKALTAPDVSLRLNLMEWSTSRSPSGLARSIGPEMRPSFCSQLTPTVPPLAALTCLSNTPRIESNSASQSVTSRP
jgi:alkylation response protein AidB-like acyl-CoA dehydrogenase